jgi:hypothetical protein
MKIPALDPRPMPLVAPLVGGLRVPRALDRIDLVERAAQVRPPAHAVKDEKFVLRPEQRRIGNASGLQIRLRTLAQRARIALITLHRGRLDHIAAQVHRGVFKKRIDHRGGRIGQQNHVRLVDPLPPRNRGAVEHLALDKELLRHVARRNAHVLLLAPGVGEPQISPLDLFFFDHLHHIARTHTASV